MSTSAIHQSRKSSGEANPPPQFRPDPDIIGNIEGNKRRQEKDREAARALLRELDQQQR